MTFRNDVTMALARLGVDRLVLAIHPASFPGGANDIGSGTPYGDAGHAFLAFIAELGFTGVMLGPAGITSRSNPSPYDSTWFSRSPMLLDFDDLPYGVQVDVGARGVASDRIEHVAAWDAAHALLLEARGRLSDRTALDGAIEALRARAAWLDLEARYEARAALDGDDWRTWGDDVVIHDEERADAFRIGQALLDAQHARFRARAHALGLRIYADLHIGASHRDRFLHRSAFLPGYLMGAPPSRTNPDGQPWGYPVLAQTGEARALVDARLRELLASHDGLRIDHPHGWVCPWVYDASADDPQRAVREGARLHESPDLPDHPALAAHAYVEAAQIDHALPRHHDHWVRGLREEQVAAFSSAFDVMVALSSSYGIDARDLAVEVLSTCPTPLAATLARHGLGRFRVTQKAKVEDATDPYRSDNARPPDWIMVGNHDTPPLRRVLSTWDAAERARRATWLASRLATEASALQGDAGLLADAMLAELFVSPARQVSLFWPDLFGEDAHFNRPGVVSSENWTMRVPARFEDAWKAALQAGEAPRLGRALALALRAQPLDAEGQALAARLAHA